MNRSLTIKWAIIVAAAAWAVYSLMPTFKLATGADELEPERREELMDKAIKRGLDLEGGMYLVLEVDTDQLEEDADVEDAIDRVIEILRNRVDAFGVSEPVIQKEGGRRIVVQLPGLQDADRAKRLIGQTARLEFKIARKGAEVRNLVDKLDRVLAGLDLETSENSEAMDTGTDPDVATADSSAVDDMFAEVDDSTTSDVANDLAKTLSANTNGWSESYGALMVPSSRRAAVDAMLALQQVSRAIPRDVEFAWGKDAMNFEGVAEPLVPLYVLGSRIELSGEHIQNAFSSPDPERPAGGTQVNLDFTRRGGLRFANVTGSHTGSHMAILLDDVVQSAPTIQGKITGGNARITGTFSASETRDLSLMLRAGALPADVHIEEERTVGPSLGQESIDKGVRSVLWGGVVVVVFIILYYKLAGILATFGLALTLTLLMGILAQLQLTLTLPGIAGIILTVGMAVDANVLIFERIREELREGKTVRGAIEAGYGQATRAIVDANVTTFIAAVVLFYFGTGPIKGFAVTLSLGILTSMFSALVFTRAVYETWLGNRSPRSLSI